LVVGDVMADRYIWGRVNRISPEAPVPVVEIEREEIRPGGAANVAANLIAYGVKVSLSGVVGSDQLGGQLRDACLRAGIDPLGLVEDCKRPTTSKTRVLGNSQQMLRLDLETSSPISPETEDELLRKIKSMPRWDALILEDYDKGVLNETLIQQLIQLAQRLNTPVFVDPKYKNFFSYTGCTWFKPNLKELGTALQQTFQDPTIEWILKLVNRLRDQMPHDYSLVTLSERGVLLVEPNADFTHLPAHVREIRDVSGAGDAVIAALAIGIILGLSPHEAARWANLAGGLACEELGVAPISLERLIHECQQL
jgi:rfaE bifunctional protein kinase chain/domain